MDWKNKDDVRKYHREYKQKWRLTEHGKKKDREASNRYRLKHRKKLLKKKKAYYHNNKTMSLYKRYGMTEDDYNAMFNKQQGACAICWNEQETLCVDHNHKTGAVRGLLCVPCNAGLGSFKDSPGLLHSASEYLERSEYTA